MSRPSQSLKRDFAEALFATNKESAGLGYFSEEFDAMLKMYGGVETAIKLVKSSEIQSGLRRLRDLGRLDLR